MGFRNDTFPQAIYGLEDVFSGYILYLKIWTSNSDPKLVGRWYLEHLYNTRGMYDMYTQHAYSRVNINIILLFLRSYKQSSAN